MTSLRPCFTLSFINARLSYFGHTILSLPFYSIGLPFCPSPICPYHFVQYHFVVPFFSSTILSGKYEVAYSFIPAISIAPLQVLYYSEALPTTARILHRSFDSTKAPSRPTQDIRSHIDYRRIYCLRLIRQLVFLS